MSLIFKKDKAKTLFDLAKQKITETLNSIDTNKLRVIAAFTAQKLNEEMLKEKVKVLNRTLWSIDHV